MRQIALIFFLLAVVKNCFSQTSFPYKNAALPINERVKDLLQRMTAEEKFRQLFMVGQDEKFDSTQFKNGIFGLQLNANVSTNEATQQVMNYSKVNSATDFLNKTNTIQKYLVTKTRLGIPAIFFGEALHGVIAKEATSFPQSIALAATFDTLLMQQISLAIAAECKQRGIRQLLSPVVNIANDVRWGRVEETYGEDPYLTTQMSIAYVKPLEQNGIITTPKHFIANVGDGGRDSYPIHLNEQYLNEIYYKPFKASIQQGGATSIMTSYNSLNGTASSMNKELLIDKLKKEWKFKGFVISDASAVGGANVLHNTSPDYPTSGKQAIENGLDVIFQTSITHDTLFNPYFLNKEIDDAIIDSAVARILRVKFKLGLFENPYAQPMEVDYAKHEQLAYQAAVKGIVLLKNNSVLPIQSSVKKIVIIGKDAGTSRLGGYSGSGRNKTSIVAGIKKMAPPNVQIEYIKGPDWEENSMTVIAKKYLSNGNEQQGITVSYYNNIILSGNPIIKNVDDINFHYTFYAPDKSLDKNFYSCKFEGKINCPVSGLRKIGLEGNDGYRLYLDDKLVIDNWQKISYHQKLVPFYFEKNKLYNIKVEFYEPQGNGKLKLIWDLEKRNKDDEALLKQTISKVRNADLIIYTAGITEGEFQDRATLNLPGKQENWINKLAITDKPIVVLLVGGSAITMNNWIDNADAIVDTWYSGEQSGNAIAAILFGKENPSGRLPITFPISEGQLPLVYNHLPTGRGDDYVNLSGQPLFPFGYGLSYASFKYSNIELNKQKINAAEIANLSVTIENTSNVDGDEVVQLYSNQVVATLAQPVQKLIGFKRINIKAGTLKQINFTIGADQLKQFNTRNEEIVEAGKYTLMVGSSSREIKGKVFLIVE